MLDADICIHGVICWAQVQETITNVTQSSESLTCIHTPGNIGTPNISQKVLSQAYIYIYIYIYGFDEYVPSDEGYDMT